MDKGVTRHLRIHSGEKPIALQTSTTGKPTPSKCLSRGRFDDVVLEKVCEEFRVGHDLDNFPKLPVSVGGDTDILLGTQYMKYWPKQVFQLSNGCTLYESQFTIYPYLGIGIL